MKLTLEKVRSNNPDNLISLKYQFHLTTMGTGFFGWNINRINKNSFSFTM